jgi:hypothetical protein
LLKEKDVRHLWYLAVAFQSVFRVEIHQNNIFYFLKIIFEIKISKQSKTHKKINFYKKN